jgi:hypothetical protein
MYVVRTPDQKIWLSTGTTRYPFPTWDAYQAAVFVAAQQGRPLPDPVDITAEQLAGFGVAIGG